MTEVLDRFLSASHYFIVPSFVFAFIGLCFLLYAQNNNPIDKVKTLKIGAILFGQILVLTVILWAVSSILENRARQELIKILKQPNIILRIDGQLIDKANTKAIIQELMKVRSIDAHHSSPTNDISIELVLSNRTEVI